MDGDEGEEGGALKEEELQSSRTGATPSKAAQSSKKSGTKRSSRPWASVERVGEITADLVIGAWPQEGEAAVADVTDFLVGKPPPSLQEGS